ncbi:hypothetical protein A3K63_04430 [Candidatus Micrarchaeota archaeon RBG_16_49_10]|nr:MAG: hypothetical protein A3K63_04430 [Candidatus Micrarchaeota archaeon RBG_16_49_10]
MIDPYYIDISPEGELVVGWKGDTIVIPLRGHSPSTLAKMLMGHGIKPQMAEKIASAAFTL